MNYARLHKELNNSNISINQLFKKIGLSKSAFYYSLNNRTIKVETLEKIAEALNIPVTEFFLSVDKPVIIEPGLNDNQKNIDFKQAYNVCEIEKKALEDQLKELKKLLLK